MRLFTSCWTFISRGGISRVNENRQPQRYYNEHNIREHIICAYACAMQAGLVAQLLTKDPKSKVKAEYSTHISKVETIIVDTNIYSPAAALQ